MEEKTEEKNTNIYIGRLVNNNRFIKQPEHHESVKVNEETSNQTDCQQFLF